MKTERLAILDSCLEDIQFALETLQEVRDEEEEAYDNLPESLQDGEKGDMMQDAIDSLDDAICSIEEAADTLEMITSDAADDLVQEIDPWQTLCVGDTVTHKSFGEGKIKTINGKYFTIVFGEKESKFIFPEAIDKGYITL